MSGYSKVTVNKVKKTLKATGVSMRMTPVRLRKLASFMTRFLFCWASHFGRDQSQRAHLPSSRVPEPALSAQRPPILCRHSAPSTRRASSGRSMRSPASLPCYPPVSSHTPFDLRHWSPCLHNIDYQPHAPYLKRGSALPLSTELPRRLTFSETDGSKPRHQHTVYSAQSTVTPCSCCLLAGYSHTCCKDLLQGPTTGCCSRVAGELVRSAQGQVSQRRDREG